MRASYSAVYARALSKIRVSLELSAAFVQIGGVLIVPHGTSWEAEFKDGGRMQKLLGLSAPTIHKYRLAQVEYTALVFEKVSDTDSLYPRATGIPAKRPL